MRDIETRLLRYFVTVAEAQHFANAAERLGISPPTLTHQIKKLESQVGAKLLRRKGNTKVAITAAGQRVLALARDALQRVEQVPVVAQQAERGELGHLELGFVAPVFGAGLLQRWVGPFEQAHPAIKIAINRLAPMAQIAGIVRKELDAGFARPPNKYPSGVRGFEVYRQPLVLALPSKHPLTRQKAISPAMLAKEALVNTIPELDVGFFGYTEIIAGIGNFIPNVVRRNADLTAVLGYVGLGHGIAVVPELMKTMGVSDVVFRNIAADPVPQSSIAFVYSSEPSPSAKLLIQHMRRHALRKDGKGAAPLHDHHRIMIPSALNLDPHPEVRAKRASKDEAEALGPRASRLGAELVIGPAKGRTRWRRVPHQGEEMSQR